MGYTQWNQRNPRVVMKPTLPPPLVTQGVVVTTTPGAIDDELVGIVTTLGFQSCRDTIFLPLYAFFLSLSCIRSFLMPGLVDSHIHAPQYVNCGLGQDLPLLQWLEKYTFPAEARYADIEFARDAYTKAVVSHYIIAVKSCHIFIFSSMPPRRCECNFDLFSCPFCDSIAPYIEERDHHRLLLRNDTSGAHTWTVWYHW